LSQVQNIIGFQHLFNNILKYLFYQHQFSLGNCRFLKFMRFYRRCNIKHSQPHCVPSLYWWCRRSFINSLCFLQLLNCLYHYLLRFMLLFLIYNIFILPWFFLLEYLLFCDFAYCNNIHIYYIHIYSDCLNLDYRFPLWAWCIFPLEHFWHLYKLGTICHFITPLNHKCGKHTSYSSNLSDVDW